MKEIKDFTQIAYVMSNMVKQLLSGKDIPKKKVKVEVEVWEPVVEVIDTIANEMEVDQQTVFNQLVQEGLNMKLQEGLQSSQSTPEPEPDVDVKQASESLGVDISGLMEKMQGLQNIAQQLQGMQQMFEGINASTQPSNNPREYMGIPRDNFRPSGGKKDNK